MSDLEQLAIQRIKAASEMSLSHYKQPLICTYSGGKDSDVMLELFRRSGIPFEVLNSHTTADAPPNCAAHPRSVPPAGAGRDQLQDRASDIQGRANKHVESDFTEVYSTDTHS